MNNNRNNNRRRGRGSNRPQGRGEQVNRIDSRARGNAPQMLEKYRKLAQDAHLNGDRVTAEYYLQFADHYFRVIADTRLRQEEQRSPRDERFGEAGGGADEDGDYGDGGDFGGFEQPGYRRQEPREQPEPRDYRAEQRNYRGEPREERAESARDDETETADGGERDAPQSQPVAQAGSPFETPGSNPFTRDNRATRGLRPRREAVRPPNEPPSGEDGGNGLDPATLPPAIAEAREEIADAAEAAAVAPRRRGRPRRPRPEEDGQGSLEVVG